MVAVGIVYGLLTALFHSLAYLGSRWYTQSSTGGGAKRSMIQLLVLAQVMMGAVAVLALPFVWREELGRDWRWVWEVVPILVFFVLAQGSLLSALRLADASRVAPLLGFKVALLALLTSLGEDKLTAWQWGAVAVAVFSAFLLNGMGGRLPWRATVLVGMACVGYAGADIFLMRIINVFRAVGGAGMSDIHASLLTVSVVYVALGAVALMLLPVWGSRKVTDWRDAMPYSGAWFAAMVSLYLTFATVGVVLGAILQSTRGLISIGLGVLLAAWGHHHLESKSGAGVVWRRLAVAALMSLAVAMYVLGGR